MSVPKFSIGEKVKLINDSLIYTVVDLYKEGFIFKYKIISKDLTYKTIVLESDIE
jgi:hypothetical protein